MENPLYLISRYMPAEVDFLSVFLFAGIVSAVVLLLGFLFHTFFGEDSDLNHALSSAIGVLCIYAVTIVIDSLNPYGLDRFLSPLPFVEFVGENLMILPISAMEFPALCSEILSMVILAFLINLLDTIIPQGEKIFSWLLLKILTVILGMGLHFLVTWCLDTFLPGVVVTYAPMILLVVLIVFLFLGLIKLLLGFALAAIDPIVGILSYFLFSNIIGKQLSKAVFSTAMLCGAAYFLEQCGYTVICISAAALLSYLPLILVLPALWYVIGTL